MGEERDLLDLGRAGTAKEDGAREEEAWAVMSGDGYVPDLAV